MCITLTQNFSKVSENIAQLYQDDRKKNIFPPLAEIFLMWTNAAEQMLPIQMSLSQLESVLDVLRNLHSNFRPHQVSNF